MPFVEPISGREVAAGKKKEEEDALLAALSEESAISETLLLLWTDSGVGQPWSGELEGSGFATSAGVS